MPKPVILYDLDTLLHHSVEVIAHKVIDAHESPDRIHRILGALTSDNSCELVEMSTEGNQAQIIDYISRIHSNDYIRHIQTIFERFLASGAVEQDGCVLPECFPHYSLLSISKSHDQSTTEDDQGMSRFRLPEDPFAHMGYYSFDLSAGMSKDTFKSTVAAAGLSIRGVDMLLESPSQSSKPIIFALTRPPGHHACRNLAGGYCYFNNAAIAADALLSKLGPRLTLAGEKSDRPERESRVVILDLDFHHGNGTQALTYTRREPAYISIHGKGEYPYYTGFEDECGAGEGQGFNRNLPLLARPKSTTEEYLALLEEACVKIKNEWKSKYLVVSMGFDTYRKDVLGGFELDCEDYTTIGARIRSLGLPTLALLEGGYSEELGELAKAFIHGLGDI
ncbi:SubName: Full=Related to histone deacetylase superfamily-Chloroflexus aggregans DSM 9485 {ECO:0000313/EMBL:CCA70612.1} [Serendipita indica DSM 11827]|nr:SubName: Full=Related to histone deacetylase superfamily-Chloroflexus aggregans DSM 9485 {ECO:0000313/EMBL:CCA70612.1} [Serendipita indica DSM 11827]